MQGDENEPPKKSSRFNLEHVFSSEEEVAWDMEPDLQKFFDMYCRKHIPDIEREN